MKKVKLSYQVKQTLVAKGKKKKKKLIKKTENLDLDEVMTPNNHLKKRQEV